MATYLILNLLMLLVVVTLLRLRYGKLRWNRTHSYVLLLLLVTTAVFDSLLIATDIVRYDPRLLLGVYIIRAPIEDFFYPLVAVLVMPILWHTSGRNHE